MPAGPDSQRATGFGGWDHVNPHRAIDAYLVEHTPNAEWFGVAGNQRGHQDIVDMLTGAAQRGAYQLGAVDYTTVAIGSDTVTEAVQLGPPLVSGKPR